MTVIEHFEYFEDIETPSGLRPELQNVRVGLRPLQETDAEQLYDIVDANRPELAKFWWEAGTRSPEDSRQFIAAVNADEASNGAPTRGICVDEKLVGVAALHTVDWQARRSLMGYWIDKREAGKGYTTRAAGILLHEAFLNLGLEEVRITARASNERSLAIARKLGFTLLGIQKEPTWQTDEHVDTAIYGLSQKDYLKEKSAFRPLM